MSEKVVVEKIPWVFVIILTAFLGLIVHPWTQLLGPMNNFYNLGLIVCSLGLTTLSILPLLILWVLRSLGIVRQVSPMSIIVLYAVGSSTAWYGIWWSSNLTLLDWAGVRLRYPELFAKVPSFLSPPADILNQAIVGGGSVPWGAWLPTMGFWWAWFFINGIFFVSLSTIMRRNWIDVERVPFAQAMIAYEVVKKVKEEKPKERLWRAPFGWGIALGMIFNLPILLTYLFPWFPDIYAWRTNTCGHGAITTPPSPIWDLVGITMINKHPLSVAIMYLAPLQVLFSYWVWYFVYLILMQVAYIMGNYTGIMDDPTGCCRTWGSTNVRFNEPFKWNAFSRGAQIGLTIFYLIVTYRYYAGTIKTALGRSDAYKDEAVPYRLSYGLFLLAFILYTALMLVCGFSLEAAVLMPITAFLFWIANARVWGTTGTHIQSAEGGPAIYRLLMWPQAPVPPTGEFMMAGTWSAWHVNTPVEGNAGSLLSSFCAYRLASLTGVSSKSVFKIFLVIQAILPIAFITGTLWVYNTFGAGKLATNPFGTANAVDRIASPSNWDRIPGTDPWTPIFFTGMILTGVIALLHARLMWFPFEPIGFLMAFSDASLFFGMWLPALIAWILKRVTLKIGGSKLYEGYGVPIATGFGVGFVSIAFIGGLIGIYRFFMPF